MLYEEWDLEKFGAMQREEGIEIGLEIGQEKLGATTLNIARKALEKGATPEFARRLAGSKNAFRIT